MVAVRSRSWVLRCLVFAAIVIVASEATAGVCGADGNIVAWGDNYWHACEVPSGGDWVGISAKNDTGAAVRAPGGGIAVWGFCQCSNHQCDLPAPNTGFVGVAESGCHTMVLRSDGSLFGWGSNAFGQCSVPDENSAFVAVEAGYSFTLALRSDGTVLVWGDPSDGRCEVPEPNAGFLAIAAGYNHCLALRSDGSIAAWGRNDRGQCDVPEPNTGFLAVSAGSWISMGLKADGSILVWGHNGYGECNVPEPNVGYTAISAGAVHCLAIRSDRTVVGWGWNIGAQCDVPAPNEGFTAIAAGASFSMGIKNAGIGACCRANGYCSVTAPLFCGGSSVFQGAGTVCVPRPCDVSTVEPVPVALARLVALRNPGNGPVEFRLGDAGSAPVSVDIIDASGRLVRHLDGIARTAAGSSLVWDGRDEAGTATPAGVYLVRAEGATGVATGTVVRTR